MRLLLFNIVYCSIEYYNIEGQGTTSTTSRMCFKIICGNFEQTSYGPNNIYLSNKLFRVERDHKWPSMIPCAGTRRIGV